MSLWGKTFVISTNTNDVKSNKTEQSHGFHHVQCHTTQTSFDWQTTEKKFTFFFFGGIVLSQLTISSTIYFSGKFNKKKRKTTFGDVK